jgi:hypothetical protein
MVRIVLIVLFLGFALAPATFVLSTDFPTQDGDTTGLFARGTLLH